MKTKNLRPYSGSLNISRKQSYLTMVHVYLFKNKIVLYYKDIYWLNNDSSCLAKEIMTINGVWTSDLNQHRF